LSKLASTAGIVGAVTEPGGSHCSVMIRLTEKVRPAIATWASSTAVAVSTCVPEVPEGEDTSHVLVAFVNETALVRAVGTAISYDNEHVDPAGVVE